MTFLGQFNCSQIARTLAPNYFPTSGLLYFFNFVDIDGSFYGHETDEPTFAVVHVDTMNLVRTEMPDSSHELEYCTRLLTPKIGLSIPDLTDPAASVLDLSDSEQADYTQLFLELGGSEHQLFGYPALIQPYPDSFHGRDLLLQVISDMDDHDFIWGDCGYLYFTVPRQSDNPLNDLCADVVS